MRGAPEHRRWPWAVARHIEVGPGSPSKLDASNTRPRKSAARGSHQHTPDLLHTPLATSPVRADLQPGPVSIPRAVSTLSAFAQCSPDEQGGVNYKTHSVDAFQVVTVRIASLMMSADRIDLKFAHPSISSSEVRSPPSCR